MARSIRNDRSGETIEVTRTDEQACADFLKAHANKQHWLWFWIHRSTPEHTAVQAESINEVANATRFLGDQFIVALGYGLKRPMIRVHFNDERFKIYLSPKGTVCVKAGMLVQQGWTCGCSPRDPGHGENCPARRATYGEDPTGHEEYIGCFHGGRFLPMKEQATRRQYYGGWRSRRRYQGYEEVANPNAGRVRELTHTERAFLAGLADNPTTFLAILSKDMGRCCYCNQPLSDARSKRAGYGMTCAKHWGLPWGESTTEKIPSFSAAYNATAAGFCWDIRNNPREEATWLIFSDWLQDQGLPTCKMPEEGVNLPRNDNLPRPGEQLVNVPEEKQEEPKPEQPKQEPVVDPAQEPLPSDFFTYTKEDQVMRCEASDLGARRGSTVGRDRIWIRSARTGAVSECKRTTTAKDADGDVEYWQYEPVVPNGVKAIVIYND